jgi:hypothetical protein
MNRSSDHHGARQTFRRKSAAWDLFEDPAERGRFLETFMVASWLEHLRQHQCVTNADRLIQDAIREFGAADAIDPSRKSSTPFAVTYEAATLPSGRAKLLSSG